MHTAQARDKAPGRLRFVRDSKEGTIVAMSTINRFIFLFDTAFQALPVKVGMVETERLAKLVHYAMESKTRAYHTSEHVFGLCEGMQPLQVLAALFHDLVYYQLDGGFPAHTANLLDDVIRSEEGALTLQTIRPDDTALALCADLFGFESGQVLPLYGGLNEFLSAVVAARLLQAHLSAADLMAVVACIESTIPFRKPDGQGRTAADRLAQRVQVHTRGLPGNRDPDAAQAMVHRVVRDAIALANRDVDSFSAQDPGLFLSSTWLLIEESNAPLAAAGQYTLQEYRHGLTRMDGFLRNLEPGDIFQHYQGYPSPREVDGLCTAADRNIAFACDFLGAKIASLAIIEALALCTGTDGPVSMFLGDIRSADGRPERIEDFLPPVTPTARFNPDLLRVFEKGRTQESTNDLTTSPITAFVYRCTGHAGTAYTLAQARKMFDGVLTPQAFLHSLEGGMVRAIVRACSHIALSRRAALLELARNL